MQTKEDRAGATSTAQGSILVEAPIETVYGQWMQVENFVKFITAVEEVRRLDANDFLITASYSGERHESVFEIILRVSLRRLAWRLLTTSSSDQLVAGVVSFTAQSDQCTCVTLKISSVFDGAIASEVDGYLQNFKQLIEDQIRQANELESTKSP